MNYEVLEPYKFRFFNETHETILNDINYNYKLYINNRNFLLKKIDNLFSKFNKSYSPFVKVLDINNLKTLNTLLNAINCNIRLDYEFNKRSISISYRKNIEYITEMSIEVIANITNETIKITYQILNVCDSSIMDYDTIELKPSEYILFKPHTYIKCNSNDDLLIFDISPKYIKYGLITVPEYDKVFIQK